MATVLKKFKGYSKSTVFLMSEDQRVFVRKVSDVERNLERYKKLSKLNLNVPDILAVDVDYYDMEYIPNLDIKTFLAQNQANSLIEFLEQVIKTLSANYVDKDFTAIYQNKLSTVEFDHYNLIFTAEQLINKLPKQLPSSEYHGDFTLENILFNNREQKFVLIDPLSTEYDSYVFDLAKLRQDLTCKWFIRNDNVYFDGKLKQISDRLSHIPYFDNDYLLILMLIRVMPYARNEEDRNFLIKEVNRLWK